MKNYRKLLTLALVASTVLGSHQMIFADSATIVVPIARPSQTLIKTSQPIRMRLGARFLLPASGKILFTKVSESDVIQTQIADSRTLTVTALREGKATLAVFVARDAQDKVGKPHVFVIEVEESSQQGQARVVTPQRLSLQSRRVRLINFPTNLLSFKVSNPKVLEARVATSRTLAITGQAEGQATLVVFTSRFSGDKVGKSQSYGIEVTPDAARNSETKVVEASKFELKSVWVVDAEPHQFIWQVNGLPSVVFKSLTSDTLRKWVAELPANSTIEWSPSDLRIGGEPSSDEIKAFQDFCKAKNVKFIIHPAG